MKKALSFDDVLIVPKYSEIASRANVNTTVNFLGENIFPLISSNMDSVTGADMAKAMLEEGCQAALHRFQSVEDNVKMFKQAPRSIVSIGLGDAELERAAALLNAGATKFLIDVAHGANVEVVRQTKALRLLVGPKNKIIVGNFATGESIKTFLYHLGDKYAIDAVKVGIGGGSACTTRIVTGCGLPTLHSVIDCRSAGLPIIADGGIRNSGDFAKALTAGASVVMVGKLLAGSDESSGELKTIYFDDSEVYLKDLREPLSNFLKSSNLRKGKKSYRGSASLESYEAQGKTAKHRTPEGESFLIPYSGPVKNTIQTLDAGLRSAMSYVGASNITEFQERAELVQITNAGVVESGAHGAK
jgi:IMP dehydrogenase